MRTRARRIPLSLWAEAISRSPPRRFCRLREILPRRNPLPLTCGFSTGNISIFWVRSVNVYCKPISDYSDLYQYIAVTSRDAEIKKICDDYIESLLGEKNQKKLTEIGMLSPYYDIYSSDNPAADELERARIGYTLNVFTSAEGLNGVNAAAKDVLAGGNAEVLKNFLKAI